MLFSSCASAHGVLEELQGPQRRSCSSLWLSPSQSFDSSSASLPMTTFGVNIRLKQHRRDLASEKDKCLQSWEYWGEAGNGHADECIFLFLSKWNLICLCLNQESPWRFHLARALWRLLTACGFGREKWLILLKEKWILCFCIWCLCWHRETLGGSGSNAPRL